MRTTLVILAALASCACGTARGTSPFEPSSPVSAVDFRGGGATPEALICAFSLSTAVKGYHGIVATTVGEPEPCPAPEVNWRLLSNPDGVTYRTYATYADLLVDRPTTGLSRYVKLLSFIHANGVCFAADSPAVNLSRAVGMQGFPQEKCEDLL